MVKDFDPLIINCASLIHTLSAFWKLFPRCCLLSFIVHHPISSRNSKIFYKSVRGVALHCFLVSCLGVTPIFFVLEAKEMQIVVAEPSPLYNFCRISIVSLQTNLKCNYNCMTDSNPFEFSFSSTPFNTRSIHDLFIHCNIFYPNIVNINCRMPVSFFRTHSVRSSRPPATGVHSGNGTLSRSQSLSTRKPDVRHKFWQDKPRKGEIRYIPSEKMIESFEKDPALIKLIDKQRNKLDHCVYIYETPKMEISRQIFCSWARPQPTTV